VGLGAAAAAVLIHQAVPRQVTALPTAREDMPAIQRHAA
jgi:hypothetical protein